MQPNSDPDKRFLLFMTGPSCTGRICIEKRPVKTTKMCMCEKNQALNDALNGIPVINMTYYARHNSLRHACPGWQTHFELRQAKDTDISLAYTRKGYTPI